MTLAQRTGAAVSPGWKGGIVLVIYKNKPKQGLLRSKPVNILRTVILRQRVSSIQSGKTESGGVYSSLLTRVPFQPQVFNPQVFIGTSAWLLRTNLRNYNLLRTNWMSCTER